MTVDTSKLESELRFAALVNSTEEIVKFSNEALQKIASIRNGLHLVDIRNPEMREYVEQKLRECDEQETYFQNVIEDAQRRLKQTYVLRNIANTLKDIVEDIKASEPLDDEGYPIPEP